jgi:hypothetical protein
MPLEYDHSNGLPPLRPERPPAVPVEALVAVSQVRLAASDVPPGILRQFYERVLGLKYLSGDGDGLLFAHGRRQVLLERGRNDAGQIGLIVRFFDDSLIRLRGALVDYELLHTDGGLTRIALLRDPAGNWVQLVETRNF